MTELTTTTTPGAGTIGDLAVQLTGSSEDEHRLAAVGEIAQTFGAHLIGVHLHLLPDILDIADPLQSGTIRSLLEASEQEADRSFKSLEARFAKLSCSHELRRLHGLPADVANDLASLARTVDLFVGTRPYGDPDGRYRLEETVLFGAGRSCLFLPPGGSPHRHFDTVVVAWDTSRETVRAIAEAMPMLRRAQMVHLLHVASPFDENKEYEQQLPRITAHLRRHGIGAEPTVVPFIAGTGEQIEQFAHQQNADLLVMGAYGHSRLVELVFGGATRYVLRRATLPVLMAH